MTRKGLVFTILVVVFSLFTGALVFAMSGVNQDGSFYHTPEVQKQSSDTIRIIGTLDCRMAEQNQGDACSLLLTEKSTGKIFDLQNDRRAMALYQAGNKNVEIEGRVTAENRVQVSQAQAL